MAEDIHQHVFVKSKLEGKHVSAMNCQSVWDTHSESEFPELIDYRSYDMFSLFGSRRSDWFELSTGERGIPEFIKKDCPTFTAYVTGPEFNHYGWRWFTYPELIRGIKVYLDRLSAPEKYFIDEDTDEYLDIKDGKFDEIYPDWRKNAEILSNMLKEILAKLERMKQNHDEYDLQRLYDLDEVVFLFWFDN